MSTKTFKYILDFSGNTSKITQQVGGLNGVLKSAAVAAGAFFAVDKVTDAAAAVYGYAKEISGVRKEVQQLTGAQGAALNDITGDVQAIAQAYDAEVKDAIAASNLVMREFKENSRDTFDILNAGMASAANISGDFLEQVKEYAPHFTEAGLTASEMVAVMAEGNKLGVFNDKTADSIKEGSIRLREMTTNTKAALDAIGLSSTQIQRDISSGNKSMFEVMQMVSRQLRTLPEQSPAVGAALADIFGGPGEDAVQFIRNLDQIDTSMASLVEGATEASKAQMAWADELAEFHRIGAQVFGGTGEMITKLKTTMLGWVNDAVRGTVSVINYFIDLYNETDEFRALIEGLGFSFKTLWTISKQSLGLIWDSLSGIGELIVGVFTGDLGMIKQAWNNWGNDIASRVTTIGETTAKNFREAIENTLTPKDKISFISIDSSEAYEIGKEAGEQMALGIVSAARGNGVSMNVMSSVGANTGQIKEIAQSIAEANQKAMDEEALEPKLKLDGFFQSTAVYKNVMQQLGDEQTLLKEKQDAVSMAMSDGFAHIGESIAGSLGLAESGMEGFLGTLLSTTVSAIAMFQGQALAAAITGAEMSGAGTGPLAVFTTPAFLATMIGGVLSAFAAIPKFEWGGVVPGTSFTGDRVLARLNSGEEVLRRDDPRHVFNGGKNERTSGGRDRIFIGRTRIDRGHIYIAYEEAKAEIYNLT